MDPRGRQRRELGSGIGLRDTEEAPREAVDAPISRTVQLSPVWGIEALLDLHLELVVAGLRD